MMAATASEVQVEASPTELLLPPRRASLRWEMLTLEILRTAEMTAGLLLPVVAVLMVWEKPRWILTATGLALAFMLFDIYTHLNRARRALHLAREGYFKQAEIQAVRRRPFLSSLFAVRFTDAFGRRVETAYRWPAWVAVSRRRWELGAIHLVASRTAETGEFALLCFDRDQPRRCLLLAHLGALVRFM